MPLSECVVVVVVMEVVVLEGRNRAYTLILNRSLTGARYFPADVSWALLPVAAAAVSSSGWNQRDRR